MATGPTSTHRSGESSGRNVTKSANAIVLLSGGLDSATCLAIAKEMGFTVHAISFRYGQRHQYELDCAKRLAETQAVSSHRIVDIDLGAFGGSALTDSSIDVPKSDSVEAMGDDIPVTYVPARNTIFLSLSLAMAEVIGARDIFIGVNALDYSGYPDCRPEFVSAFERMANLATKQSVESESKLTIHAPLIDLTKSEIIAKGLKLGVDYSKTISCYDPDESGTACKRCDACLLRARGFADQGITE